MRGSPTQNQVYDARLARFATALRKLTDTGAFVVSVDDDLLHVVLPNHIRHVEGADPEKPGAFRLVEAAS